MSDAHPQKSRRPQRGGFTLIELLASMAILMVIVWVLAAIFRESDRAWAMGTGRVDNNMEGRALIQMVANDLQYAICDGNMTFIIQDERDKQGPTSGYLTYGHTNSEICFVNLSEDATPSGGDKRRATREMMYYVRTLGDDDPVLQHQYRVMRSEFSASMVKSGTEQDHSYYNPDWYDDNTRRGKLVAEHIIAFSAYVPTTNGTGMTRNYDSRDHDNTLPLYVDIFVEVLNDKEAEQLALIMTADPMTRMGMQMTGELDRFIEQNARRYVRRVYLRNRVGYMSRGSYPNRNP
ncbi:MAG: prepilin-type N-terminal cleavage/methylation domain-containing protein [Kiritimatiellia bacterium]|jgi:prepilin-type N-terminal cleavage/methylation domain-containing protein